MTRSVFPASDRRSAKPFDKICTCELVVAKEVELQFVPGEMNPADIFTKNLQKIKFTQFRNQLGLEFGAKHP